MKDTIEFDPEAPPEWDVSHWFNSASAISLGDLRGRVVAMIMFQTHCHGSRHYALPQAQRIASVFKASDISVMGLNVPFERHASQDVDAMDAFIAANRLTFPIGIDFAGEDGQPNTMNAYGVQGTPTMLIFDRHGRLRRHYLGGIDDIRLAAELTGFMMEAHGAPRSASVSMENTLSSILSDTKRKSATEVDSVLSVPAT
ncbi:MAG: redoxin domain-containing protein [Pseudomonadota bacterium]